MAETYTLDAQPRTVTGKKVSQLRNQGLVPVVVYGANIEPLHLQIPQRALYLTLLKAGGTHLIDLKVDGKKHSVLARDVQRNITRGDITHVDFLAVAADRMIAADIPVHVTGENPLVNSRQGIVVQAMNILHIEAFPGNLPSEISIDLADLKELGSSIHVSDLKLGDKIKIMNSPDDLIVRLNAFVAPTETEGEAGAAEPEVIAKGKTDEDEG